MDYLQDVKHVLLESGKKTVGSLRFIPLLIGLQVLVSVVYWLLAELFLMRGGLFGGIITALFLAALWSVYLYGLDHAVHRSRFTVNDLKAGAGVFFRDAYIAAFVLWIVRLILDLIAVPYMEYVILLAFSALPETVYLGRYQGFDNIRDAFEFLKENWYIWLPMTILMIFVLERFSFGVSLLLYRFFGPFTPDVILMYLVHAVLFSLFALFRGHLFQYLYGSNLRKRKFMGNFRR